MQGQFSHAHQHYQHKDQIVILTFKFKCHGHSAKEINSFNLKKYRSQKVDCEMYPRTINHGVQNATLTLKVKGQCHSANSLKLQYLTKLKCKWSRSYM